MQASRPENVGILAIEMYVPARYVSLSDLEKADNCAGKYTGDNGFFALGLLLFNINVLHHLTYSFYYNGIFLLPVGLGQLNMAFCDDREDVASIFLTAVHGLLEKYNIDPNCIGRLEVGTETLVDKSKSVKTSLMKLFGSNTDLEGITNVNACYGGSAALFNSIAWVESSEWTGQYALVVCGDIAVYEAGPARPTGGCGAIAMLIGPDAPLALEPGVRATHALDIYDFYKPNHSEYAMVDGKLSQWAYLSSVDVCYQRYKQKFALKNPEKAKITVDHFDFFAFHSPYNKLVQKGFGRLLYVDSLTAFDEDHFSSVKGFRNIPVDDSYENRELEAAYRTLSNSRFLERVMPACQINQNIGNCYTGSVFSSLLSVVSTQGEKLNGKRVCMFSYGSGSMASLYSFIGRTPSQDGNRFTLGLIQSTTDMIRRLSTRKQCSYEEFTVSLDLRAQKYGKAPMQPEGPIDSFFPKTYYLMSISDKHNREYFRA